MEHQMVPLTDGMKGMPITTIRAQINTIQKLMRSVMKEGEHFGVIPGTGKKSSLFKAGAEKIGLLFRLAPSYDVQSKVNDVTGHMTVQVVCTLQQIHTQQVWGQGVGIGSTLESKYRYRAGEGELTDQPVPKAYWEARDNKLIGGPGFTVKKNDDGQWRIAKKSDQKVEHDNPADFYNTVIKMAKKRAHVDAIITATAASDIFTQDIKDDEAENGKDT